MSSVVTPVSDWLWNDSEENGWLAAAENARFTTPDPFNVRYANRMWFRLENIGIRNTSTDYDVTVTFSYSQEFQADLNDYVEASWTEIGSKTLSLALGTGGGRVVEFIEWDPHEVIPGPIMASLSVNPIIYFKVDVRYEKPELRYLNNSAFLKMNVTGF
jgi:hypothetical protein